LILSIVGSLLSGWWLPVKVCPGRRRIEGAGANVFGQSPTHRRRTDTAADRYDVVVIGSGFGGAVTACRLAEAGRSVAVLERGRRWPNYNFPRAIGQVSSEAFWEEGRSHGFIEYAAFRKLDVVLGAGVGGGSLHYFNVNLPADERIFSDPRWPAAVTRASLDPYYERAREMLESRPLVAPHGRNALPERTTVFLAASQAAGYATDQVPVAVYTGPARANPITGLDQNPCTYCGNCLFGCDLRAKNTLDDNYLALAETRYGATILPLAVVDGIAPSVGGGYDVTFRRLDEADPTSPGTRQSVHATKVVVAAGVLGSARLLLSCRDVTGSLPALPGTLGRGFSLNGELLFAYAHRTSERVDPGLGPPITARATVHTDDHLITVEDLGLPDSMLWYLEGLMPPSVGRLRALASLAASYARHTLRIGSRTSTLSLELDSVVSGARTPRMMPFLGMGTDSSDGRLTLVGDALEIDWDARRNRPLYKEMTKVMASISEAAGGKFTNSFLYRWPSRKILTAHPLGGCAMGDDPGRSVVNDRGEVWSYPGLYVVDGSIIPSALAVNPSLTIAALAERAAEGMVDA
jgi:cholesterol oxidase